jgi:hypothetical protein
MATVNGKQEAVPRDPGQLPLATGILAYLALVAASKDASSLEPRHVRAIVLAYDRAGVRGEGLFEVMSRAWEARWGVGFKTQKEMVNFFMSLDDQGAQVVNPES